MPCRQQIYDNGDANRNETLPRYEIVLPLESLGYLGIEMRKVHYLRDGGDKLEMKEIVIFSAPNMLVWRWRRFQSGIVYFLNCSPVKNEI